MFAPLAALPLVAIPFAGVGGSSGSDSIIVQMAASDGIVFGGSVGDTTLRRIYIATTDTLVFGGFSRLGQAEFCTVRAIPRSYSTRANRADYTMTVKYQSFTVRGRR